MAKQLNVNLGFTADTSQAAAQIQNLQNQLTGLMNSTNGSMNFGAKVAGDVGKASKSIAELKMHLQNATNVNTGTLDFTKLNESINKSGMSLQQYGDKLRSLGPAGQQAFNALAQSVAQSEIPIRRSNAALTEMWTTLKNTARWQISSSILHGFMGAISSAVGYAKDLNRSLNDIRIVTGASVDEMARFAEQANRSAKALSASTTEYTKASLIYYQQGLDDQAVKERTDVTIKMANVSGQAAETVSDQMTAVWNNFAKGGEDLERFADVMVRLGADTASSSDEIAQGLEKFAAIGDMVGLSFDNAAAALATVTATTRQSADVVGTAFKTIFARIQGLKLGETLEDGTDLNKYSEALATVGISIKEQNGELKDMDNILAEMGAKWQTLSKDQQVALAQTVAGIRQYNQLVALMDNFDFYEKNLDSAKMADGSLQEQADIYAESWQAASARVKAATQGIYEDLLDDEAFIDVLNIIEKILTYIDNLIDGLGGLGGVLTTIGALLTRAFSAQIAQSMTSMVNGIKSMTAAGREQAQQQKAQFMKDAAETMRNTSDGSNEGNTRAAVMEDQLRLQNSMIENSEKMSAEEQRINQMLLDRQRILGENAIAAAKELDAAKENKSDATMQARTDIAASRMNADPSETGNSKTIKQLNADFTALQNRMKEQIKIKLNLKDLEKLQTEGGESGQALMDLKLMMLEFDSADEGLKEAVRSIEQMDLESEQAQATIAELIAHLDRLNQATQNEMLDLGIDEATVAGVSSSLEQEANAERKVEEATRSANQARDEATNSINNAKGAQKGWADQMVAGANVVMSLMSALQALNGIIDVATNPDMSGWEKFLSIGSSLAMVFVMLAPLLQGTNLQFLTMAATSIAGAIGVKTFSAAEIEAAISGNMAAAGTATFATALWTLLWPIGLVMAAIAALVLIVGGLIKLFKSFDEGEKLKKLEEEAQKASEAFDRTKERIEGTKAALDSLESGYETIEKLKEGTLEWYEAINNVNAEVMKLVETYPELAQYISSDNGVLKISEEGQSYLAQEMETQYATAANYKMSTEIRKNNQKLEMGKSDYIDPTGGALMVGADNYQKTTQLMQAAYEAPEIGNTLFTQQGAQSLTYANNKETIKYDVNSALGSDYEKFNQEARDKFVDSLGTLDWSNTDAIKQAATEAFGTTDFEGVDFSQISEDLLYQRDNMKMLLDANEEHIKGQKALKDANKRLQDAQFEGVLSSMGSMRNADEGKELLGGRTYEDVKTEQKAQLTGSVNNGGFGNWNDHINYKDSDPEMKLIEDFMKQVGASDYVAQRDGKMVVKIDGEEKEFSKDEVINTLTDMYSTGAAQEEITKAMATSVADAYGIATNGLKPEQLVNLDNLALGIKEGMSQGFEGSEAELTQKVNSMTQAIGQAYGSNTEALAADTAYINFDDADIQAKIVKLAEGLDGTTEKAEAFKQELKEINELGKIDSMTSTFDDAAAAMGGSKEEIAQTSAQMQRYAKHLMGVSKNSKTLSDDLVDNAEAAADVATATVRMNKGIDKLADGIQDWGSVIKKSSKESVEYCDAMFAMKDAMSDVLGVSADFLSDDFIVNNMKDIELAAQGDAAAIDRLAVAAAQDILINVDFESDAIKEEAMGLHNDLVASLPDIKVGAHLEDGDFLTNAQKLVQTAGMTVDEAQAYFNSLGYEPEFVTEEKTVMRSIPQETTHTDYAITPGTIDIMGVDVPIPTIDRITTTRVTGYEDMEETVQVPALSNDGTPQIKSLTKKSSGAMNNYSGSNSGGKSPGSSGGGGGGGGGKTKKQPKVEKPKYKDDSDKTKVEDEIERYDYITNKIEDLNRELDQLSSAKDDAWGPNRIKAMDKEIAKLKQVRAATKQYADEIKQNLANDEAAAIGVGAQMQDGIITNRNELMTQWVNELNAVKVDGYNSYEDQIVALKNKANNIDDEADEDGSQKNAIEEEISALEEQRDTEIRTAEETFEARKKALEQYEETRDLWNDTNAELEEQLRQIQQLNYEKIMYAVEFKIEVNDSELDLLDKKLGAIEKTLFKDAEAFTKINANMKQQYDILIGDENRNPYKIYSDGLDELNAKFELGKQGLEDGINEDQYIEGLGEIKDGLLDTYDTIVAMDEKMEEYYGDAISEGLDLIALYEEGFDGFLSTLDHYSKVMSLIGQEKNYEGMNSILEGRAAVLNDRLASAETTLANLEEQKSMIEAELARDDLHPDTRKQWEEELLAVEGYMRDQQDAIYGYIEDLGETANQILKNNIDKAMKELRDSLSGGINLEHLMKDMEKMSTYQEDYLTNTNKMYETNKIIAQAQLAIDKTSNAQAKQKYQEYIKYIEKLQTSEKLSKQELSIAQAKYAVLEAEIALEEARNAKSEVRLTRDSEGNFGYVYTADQDNVASATQNYLDKQNELYNISLEGTEQYREKYVQNMQNMYDELEELEYAFRVDHTISEEEYEKQKLAIQEYYQEQAQSYAELFQNAQWELASSSYSTLMTENETFNNSQLSLNKEHYSAMEYNDAEYIGGLKTGMTGLQEQLETDLKQFNLNSYTENDRHYVEMKNRDNQYYTSLEQRTLQAQGYIYGQMTNPSANSAAHHMTSFGKTTELAFQACENAASNWELMIKPLNERVGKSFSGDESNEGLKQKIDKVTSSSSALKDYLVQHLHPTISDTWTKAFNMKQQWEEHRAKVNEVKQSYMDLATQIQNTITTMARFDQKDAPQTVSSSDIDSKYTTSSTSTGSGTGNSSNNETGKNEVGISHNDMVQLVYDMGRGVYGNNPPRRDLVEQKYPGKYDAAQAILNKAISSDNYNYHHNGNKWKTTTVESLVTAAGYDTGGYTGEWGPEGKFAVLHEKEIVLNEKDTENFLNAANILREVSQMLDTNALIASLGAINLSAMTINSPADQVLQQEVTIHADFPNVTDHNEIEMAIDNLINAASQYANRK